MKNVASGLAFRATDASTISQGTVATQTRTWSLYPRAGWSPLASMKTSESVEERSETMLSGEPDMKIGSYPAFAPLDRSVWRAISPCW